MRPSPRRWRWCWRRWRPGESRLMMSGTGSGADSLVPSDRRWLRHTRLLSFSTATTNTNRPEREGRRCREEAAAAERDRRRKTLLVKGLGVVGREASQVIMNQSTTTTSPGGRVQEGRGDCSIHTYSTRQGGVAGVT